MRHRVFSISGSEVLVLSQDLSNCERASGLIKVDMSVIIENKLVKAKQVHVVTSRSQGSFQAQQRYLCPSTSTVIGFEELSRAAPHLGRGSLYLYERLVAESQEELYLRLQPYQPPKRLPGSLLPGENGYSNIVVSLVHGKDKAAISSIGEERVQVHVTRPESDEEGSNNELLELMSVVLQKDKSELQLDWNTLKRSTVVVVHLTTKEVLQRLERVVTA